VSVELAKRKRAHKKKKKKGLVFLGALWQQKIVALLQMKRQKFFFEFKQNLGDAF
jgi:hypothetical protein